MEFEWDEAKRLRILHERGLDFADAERFFDGRPVGTEPSHRGDEQRWRSTVAIDDELVTLVWTEGDGFVRAITMRRAHAKEARQYRQIYR